MKQPLRNDSDFGRGEDAAKDDDNRSKIKGGKKATRGSITSLFLFCFFIDRPTMIDTLSWGYVT
jgi:hypothetical protein